LRQIAKQFRVSKSTAQRWIRFSAGKRLGRLDFSNQKTGAKIPRNKTSNQLEKQILTIRKHLKEKSILRLYGADAIHKEMIRRKIKNIPTTRTITNILKRNGKIDHRTRTRHKAPPPGWYLPDVVTRKAELDSFDIVEKLYLHGGQEVQLFNGISLHGSLIHSFATETVTTENTILMLIEHWKKWGLPKYVQFDNDMVFQGTRKVNAVGKVIHLCLSLRVIPVFATPYEQGFQGKIERLNGEIQQNFWQRKTFKSLKQINKKLEEYVLAHRLAHQESILTAPHRKSFPKRWKRNDNKPLKGKIIYLRRTDGEGHIHLLENDFLVNKHWVNRLIRAELDLDKRTITFYRLRRSEPNVQHVLKKIKYNVTKK
jgi:transposase